jgi:hypothetical protein
MAILASNTVRFFSVRDFLSGIIYVVYINDDDEIWLIKVAPDGSKIEFSDSSTEKRITGITATGVALIVKNGILCLKYIDDNGDLQQLFSADTGDTWGATF